MLLEEQIELVRRSDGIVLPGQQREVRKVWARSQSSLHGNPLRHYYAEGAPRAVIALHKLNIWQLTYLAKFLFMRRDIGLLVNVQEKVGLPGIERPNQPGQLVEVLVRED